MDRYNSPRGDWRRFEDEQRRRRREREYDDEFGPQGWRDWVSEDQPYERGYRYDYGRGGMGSPAWGRSRDADDMEQGNYVPGPYTGLGPRGYRRSDEDIFNDICSRLTDHGDIDAGEIEVQVEDGEVTLTGTVDSRRTKFMVEDTIDGVPGVDEIENRLSVRRPAPGEGNLREWSQQPRSSPDTRRWRGKPGRYQQRSQFGERYGEDYGYGREGERIEPETGRYGGSDFINRYDEPEYTELDRSGPYRGIGPRGYRRSDDRLCEEVCERLSRHGEIDASDIEVEVQDGEVILRGTVGDRRSKRLAEDLAESTSGVWDVHNELRISQARLSEDNMKDWTSQDTQGQSAHRNLDQQNNPVADQSRQIGGARYVVDSEGEMVGQILEMRDNDIVVKRSNLPDITIPRDKIKAISGDQIVLTETHKEIHQQNWKESEGKETWKRE